MIVENVEKSSVKPRSARLLRAGCNYPAMPSYLRPAGGILAPFQSKLL